MIYIKIDKCQSIGCDQPAESLVATHNGELKALCRKHRNEAQDEIRKRSEYIIACPNCYCIMGVGKYD